MIILLVLAWVKEKKPDRATETGVECALNARLNHV